MNYTVTIKEVGQRQLTLHDFDLLFDAIKMVSKSFIHGEDTTMYTSADEVFHGELLLTGTITDVIIDSKDYIESIVKAGITNFMRTKIKINITKDGAPPFTRTVKTEISDIQLEYTIYMCVDVDKETWKKKAKAFYEKRPEVPICKELQEIFDKED